MDERIAALAKVNLYMPLGLLHIIIWLNLTFGSVLQKDRRFDAKGEYPRARRPKHSWRSSDSSSSLGVSPDDNARSVTRRRSVTKRLGAMRKPAGPTPAPEWITRHEDDHPLDWYFPE